jgi:hypothetical protein
MMAKILQSQVVRRAYFRFWPWDTGLFQPARTCPACEEAIVQFLHDAKGGVGVWRGGDALQAATLWRAQDNRACVVLCTPGVPALDGLARRIQETMRVPGIENSRTCEPISSFLPACDPHRQAVLILDHFDTVAGDASVRQELKELALDSELSKKYKVLAVLDDAAHMHSVLQVNAGQKVRALGRTGS